ncbi:MAG TPA: hypothetical protein DCL80_06275 [Balneola sp.]|jgi:hypothetical protein|nr:hypothetical protein [Balneola sp.]|tara:strand:- start:8040 stop:8945 length:906 start_codon:yes stop_codon:yes gene_type:complete
MKKFTFVLTLLLCLPLIVQAQIKLNYNINPGSSYITKVVLEQDISQTVMGQTQDIESDQGYGIQLKFTDLEDGKYSVTMVYNSIMVNQPMAGLDYDSETATSEPTGSAKAIASVLNNELYFTLSKKGEVSNISGFEAMLDSMAVSMGITDDAQASMFKSQMSSQYNAQSIVDQLKRTLIIFPDKELNKGDTWSEDQSVTVPFAMNIQTTYELADYDDETVTLNISSDIFTEGDEANMGGATMTPDLSGVQSGTITIDRNTGLILKGGMEQLVSGILNMTSPQEMEIPLEISGKTEVVGSIE